jgi:hypothetical protein
VVAWVIQYCGGCPCWIAAPSAGSLGTDTLMSALGISYQISHAKRFAIEKEAILEMLALKLPNDWRVVRMPGVV